MRFFLGKGDSLRPKRPRLTDPELLRLMDANTLALSVERDDHPSNDLSPELRALWLAKKGRWDEAHDLCQEIPSRNGSWIHAWLHRQEGDFGNACYWYDRAGKPAPARQESLEDEWFEIARSLGG